MFKNMINLEKNFKKNSGLFAIIVMLLLVFLIIPNGTQLPPFDISFEASSDKVGATINKPTGSEIVALLLILIFITLWIYMYLKHKKVIKNEKDKK